MSPLLTTRLLLLLIVGACAVGVIDAVIDSTWDHVVLFGVGTTVGLVLLAKLSFGRQAVRLRPDLVHWLDQRSQLTGEPLGHIADRGIATYRSTLVDDTDAGPPTRGTSAPVGE